MIHRFRFDGKNIVLDVNSGSVHTVDDVGWDLLPFYPEGPCDAEINKLCEKHGAEKVEEAREEIQMLMREGLLFSPDRYENDYQLPNESVLKALCLHVAHDCNLRCRYCFGGQGFFGGDRELMQADTGRAAIDFLIERSGGRRFLDVDFFGGEPLLNFHTVKEIISYAREREKETGKRFRLTLTTNAVLFDEEVQRCLEDNDVCLVLSIDGRPEVHDKNRPFPDGSGSYWKVASNIRRFLRTTKNKNYYIRGTFTRQNLDFTADVLHLADMGAELVSLEPVMDTSGGEYALRNEDMPLVCEEYERLTRALLARARKGKGINFFHFNIDLTGGPCLPRRLQGCGAGHEYAAVAPNGDLYPCHQLVGQDEFRLGNIVENNLEIELPVEKFRQAHLYNKDACRNCWAKFFCSGGCHANAYKANGNFLRPYEAGCRLLRKRVECALYLQVMMASDTGAF